MLTFIAHRCSTLDSKNSRSPPPATATSISRSFEATFLARHSLSAWFELLFWISRVPLPLAGIWPSHEKGESLLGSRMLYIDYFPL
jgi:hypothetical protein